MSVYREAFLKAVFLTLISWGLCATGVFLGSIFVPPGPGYSGKLGIQRDLFRFDSDYYYSIAESGYSYNGDPGSSPNLVFAPLFPLLVRGLATLPGLDLVSAGFLLNKTMLLFGLMFLLLALQTRFSGRQSFFIALALATSAGSYSLHAYYSESTMLFFLSLGLFSYAKSWWGLFSGSAAALGACRLSALPIVAVFALALLDHGYRSKRRPREAWGFVAYALLAVSGALLYLGYLAFHFGNPLELIPQIQDVSWGLFHQSAAPGLWWATNLWDFWQEACSRGAATVYDIKTLNLVWTSLALVSVIYIMRKFHRHLWTFAFLAYFLFIYSSDIGSDYLISAHRLFLLMLPIFMMFTDFHLWLERHYSRGIAITASSFFLMVNAAYALLHTAFFNQGIWYYF